jgi:hypothetical protein
MSSERVKMDDEQIEIDKYDNLKWIILRYWY